MRAWGPGTRRPAGWRVLAAVTLSLGALATPGAAQTVEQRYEPFAAGAATTIYPDETALGAKDALDLLRWYVPGVVLVPPAEGEWGDWGVILRGAVGLANPAPNPLLIIDGFKVSDEDFSWRLRSLNPFQIERMTVVRDAASAAVYGGRAAGGVILVFTRRR